MLGFAELLLVEELDGVVSVRLVVVALNHEGVAAPRGEKEREKRREKEMKKEVENEEKEQEIAKKGKERMKMKMRREEEIKPQLKKRWEEEPNFQK